MTHLVKSKLTDICGYKQACKLSHTPVQICILPLLYSFTIDIINVSVAAAVAAAHDDDDAATSHV